MIVYFLVILFIYSYKELLKLLNKKESFNNKKNAYVTLVTNDLYVPGVIALGNSMRKQKCSFKKLCIYKNISNDSKEKIKEYFDLISIDDLNRKNIKLNIKLDNYKYNIERFKDAFNKLYIWSLTNYNKIIYLDCDMIVYKNLDNLFSKPSLSAVQGRPSFNSGLLVLEPSMNIFKDLNNLINEPKKWSEGNRDLLGKSINDQALLGYYFKKFNKLPRVYNVTRSYHDSINKPFIKHWNFKDKPWFKSYNREDKNEWFKFYT